MLNIKCKSKKSCYIYYECIKNTRIDGSADDALRGGNGGVIHFFFTCVRSEYIYRKN